MRKLPDNEKFFDRVTKLLLDAGGVKNSFIIYVGDDNIQNEQTQLYRLRQIMIDRFRMIDILGTFHTRKEKQPDLFLLILTLVLLL